MNKLKLLAVAVISAVIFGACNTNQEPLLPPHNSMNLNDTIFRITPKTTGNWFNAAIRLGFWTTAVHFTFSVPVYAYEFALEQEPQKVDKNTWLWEYQVDMVMSQLNVKLYGTKQENSVLWEMYINDYKWFDGETNKENTAGYWVFYSDEDNPYMRIDWTSGIKLKTNKYTIIDTKSQNYGSSLYYEENDDPIYNRIFEIFSSPDTTYTYIQWNYPSDNGRIKCEKLYNDDQWHCWDSNLQDCECQ